MKKILIIIIISGLSTFSTKVFAQKMWVAPKSADSIKNPTKNLAVSVKHGAALFKAQCEMCHGVKGNGKGIAGMYLTPHPANFTSAKIQSETDGDLFWKLTNGNSPMASYKNILTETQRWDLINYIRTFKKK